LYDILLKTKDGVICLFDTPQEPYFNVFQDLLDKAQFLEENSPEFVKLLERLYLAVVSGPLAGRKVSFGSA
jgi:hypothetical protein